MRRLWLPLALLGLLGTVFVFFDSDAKIDVSWFWIVLLLLMFLVMFGFAWFLLRAKPEPATGLPDPPISPGCLSPVLWLVPLALLMVYLIASIVWLLGDTDSAGGWWTLFPIAIALLVLGIGARLWTPQIGAQPPGCLFVPLLFLAIIIGIIASVWWFTGGRADDAVEPSRSASIVETDADTTAEVPSSSSTPVVTDKAEEPDPELVTEPDPVTEPTGMALPDNIATLLARQCADVMGGVVADLTVEALFPEPERESRPADSVSPPLHANPPAALDIMYLGAFDGGCGDTAKLIVVAYLGGPPADVQLAVALDLFEGEGHVGDPDASEKIPQIDGWDRFGAYDQVNGLFYSDADFRSIDEPVEVDMEGDVFAFIVDRPDGVEMVDVSFQTFSRDGELAESPTDWRYAGLHHEF